HTRFSRDWSSDVCSSDLLGARLREVLQNGVAVFSEDVVGRRALDEQYRSTELRITLGPADDVAEGAADHRQVEAPAEAAVRLLLQVGEQEVAHAFLAHICFQHGVSILARG